MLRYIQLLTFAHLLLPAACQMVLPKGLPLVMANWKYVATPVNRTKGDFLPSLDNWELGIATQADKCEGKAVLISPAIGEGLVFFSNYDNATLWTDKFGHIRPLYVAPPKGITDENDDNLQHVEFPCETSLTTRFRTHLVRRIPRLSAEGGGAFYVCHRHVHAQERQVFYRTTTRLPEGCIDIHLHPKCMEGIDRGERNLGFCCIDVVNGKCINNNGTAGGAGEDSVDETALFDRKGPRLNTSPV